MALARIEVPMADDDVERLFYELQDSLQQRVELIDGRVVVRPVPTIDHNLVVDRLIEALFEVKQRNGWVFFTNIHNYVRPSQDRYVHDLFIGPPDPPTYTDHEVYGAGMLLAVEVVSGGSRADDFVIKPERCAAEGVPLFLTVDGLAREPLIKLMSDPSQQGYRSVLTLKKGESLHLPAPFELGIDTDWLLS